MERTTLMDEKVSAEQQLEGLRQEVARQAELLEEAAGQLEELKQQVGEAAGAGEGGGHMPGKREGGLSHSDVLL